MVPVTACVTVADDDEVGRVVVEAVGGTGIGVGDDVLWVMCIVLRFIFACCVIALDFVFCASCTGAD